MTLPEALAEYDRLLYAPVDPEEYPALLADFRKKAGHLPKKDHMSMDVKNDGEVYP